ncbi:translation initiation factor eIF-2B epsilon subunit, GEF [Tilletia horrida]|nr:translation initiation factor eIF-2B epsilon subunit, GEF [Tilletia horrida]
MAPKPSKGGGAPAAGKGKGKGGKAVGGGGGGGGGDLDGPQEEPLLGIILADAYHTAHTSRFAPLDAALPTCLLPLAGAPILHWTIEALARADVARIYILSTRHTPLLREHIDSHFKNVYGFPPISVLPIPQAGSAGDALRELDARQIVRASDFILVHADYVGNLDLAQLVRAHKERRRRDRDAIMTVATMPAPAGGWAGASVAGDEGAGLWCIDNAKGGQLRHYSHRPIIAPPGSTGAQRVSSKSVAGESVSLPWDLLSGGEETVSDVDVHTDLVDCGVDICSMDVPPLFSENFDYQHIRRDFIPGILTSDLLTAKIFVHVAPSTPSHVPRLDLAPAHTSFGTETCNGYGARASSTKAYHALSMDVLARWLLPLGPSGILPGPATAGEGAYAVRAGHCYIHASAHLIPEPLSEYAKSSSSGGGGGITTSNAPHQTLGPHVLVGPRSRVCSSASVEHSVLDSDVAVWSRATVRGSLIHDGVSIGKDCVVLDSILGKGVKLLDGTKLGKGCLIEAGVVLGPNVEVRSGARVGLRSAAEYDDDEDEEDSEPSSKTGSQSKASPDLGAEAVGQLWPFLGERSTQEGDDDDDEEDDDGDDSAANNWRNVLLLRIGSTAAEADRLATSLEQDEGLFDEDEDDGNASLTEEELDGADEDDSEDNDEDDDADVDHDGVPSARPSAMHSRSNTNALSSGGGGGAVNNADAGGADAATVRRLLDFRSEARASLSRALAENHTLENASIELKTLRMASNVTLLELRATVLGFLMGAAERAMREATAGGGGVAAFGKVWTRWGGLIKAVASEVADQVQVVTVLQTYCATHPASTKLFVPTLKLFYNEDVVEDEAIIDWWRSPASRSAAPIGITAPGYGVSGAQRDEDDGEEEEDEIVEAGEEEMRALRASAEPVLRFIVESQEDDDDEEDEEEEEDSDEE